VGIAGSLRDDRGVPRRPHGDGDIVTTGHLDLFLPGDQRPELARVLVPAAPDALEIEVGDIGTEVGEPPGDPRVVTDDDARDAGKGEHGDARRAGRAGIGAMYL